MTAKSFLLSTIGLLLLLWVYKIFMISYFDLSGWVMPIVYALGIVVLTMSMVRRAGKLNTFEVIIGLIWWSVLVLLWDFLFLTAIVGYGMYYHIYFWVGYFVMMLTITVFHKRAPLDKK